MSETLTRAELAELIYSEVGISKTEASEIVDQFFEEIILDLIDGNSVKLTSFGTFSVKYKKERIGRNPKTKEEAIDALGHGNYKRAGTYKALNKLIQGSAADQTKKAMVDLYEQDGIIPHIQVHDELDVSVNGNENKIKEICQVEMFSNTTDNIGKINIPKPPQAVTIPAALLLFSFGKCFEIIGVRMVPAAPAKPKPTNKPRLICSHMPEI